MKTDEQIITSEIERKKNTEILVNAGDTYEWATLNYVDNSTYSIPMYCATILTGKNAGIKVGVAMFYGKRIS